MSAHSARIKLTTIKGNKMIATAIEIQNAIQESITSDLIMRQASKLVHTRDDVTDKEFARNLFEYTTSLSALIATLVTSICLPKNLMEEMVKEIEEFEELDNSVRGEK